MTSMYGRLARGLARRAGLRVFRMFSRPLESGLPRALPEGVELRLLREREVLELGRDAQLDLRQESVAAAYARGDFCVGAFDAQTVAGYCWFAFAPLPHLDGAWVEFGRRVAWTYKSLVRPAHRGRGIAPALYRFADAACLERGRGSSVICVESHNRSSVRAALTAGYAPAGYAGYLLRGSRLVSWSSAAAKGQGVSFFLPSGM